MRMFLLAATGAAAILTSGPLASRSEAMPIGPSLGPAVEAVSPVAKAGCYRWGRFGWGWYIGAVTPGDRVITGDRASGHGAGPTATGTDGPDLRENTVTA